MSGRHMEAFKRFLIDALKLEDIESSDIEDETVLFGDEGLGLDSVDSIELVILIQNEYGVNIADSKEYESIFASVKTLYDYIQANKPQ